MQRKTLLLFALSLAILLMGMTGCDPPRIVNFTAEPDTITPGETSTLSWAVLFATELSINQGVGDVTGQTSIAVSPTVTTTYTLIARNRLGSDERSVTVSVASGPTLTVSKAGLGQGTVSSNPAGINCGTTCAVPFAAGTLVTLTATPGTGYSFGGWSGACTGTGTCAVTMDAAKSVTASFQLQAIALHTLYVGWKGTGRGTITSDPAGIDCDDACSKTFTAGTTVTLTATPDGDSIFLGWDDACTGTGTCTVTMSSNLNVIATVECRWHHSCPRWWTVGRLGPLAVLPARQLRLCFPHTC